MKRRPLRVRRYVTVQCEGEGLNPHTGQRWRWCHTVDEDKGAALAADLVARGIARRAWVVS